jgi:hypothetical protein
MKPNPRPGSKSIVVAYLRQRCCGACGQLLGGVDVDDLELSDGVHFRSPPPAPKCYEVNCPHCGALLTVAERLGVVSPLLLHEAPGPSVVPRPSQG